MFTGLAKVAAALGTLLGVMLIGASIHIDTLPRAEKLEMLLLWGGKTSTQDLFNFGIVSLCSFLALGVLAEISSKMDK